MASDYAVKVVVDGAAVNSHDLLLSSSAHTATADSAEQTNTGSRGAQVIFDLTDVPLLPDGITPKVQGKDPASGKWYDLLSGGALDTVTTTVLTVYPGVTVTANKSASDVLPKIWRVTVGNTDGKSYTFSVGANVVV